MWMKEQNFAKNNPAKLIGIQITWAKYETQIKTKLKIKLYLVQLSAVLQLLELFGYVLVEIALLGV